MKTHAHTPTRSHAHTPTSPKIRNRILIMILMLFNTFAYSQTDNFCATPASNILGSPGVFSKSTNCLFLKIVEERHTK